MQESVVYVRPVFKSRDAHPAPSEVSFVFVDNWKTGDSFVVAKNHGEVQRAPESAFRVLRGVSPSAYVCSDLKAFLQSVGDPEARAVDLGMVSWWNGEEFNPELSPDNVPVEASNRLWHTPIYKLIEQLEAESNGAKEAALSGRSAISSQGFGDYTSFLRALSFLESEGLKVNEPRFRKHFGDKSDQIRRGYVYPNYSLYTSTGRPSNAFGKINYAGLEKGPERSAFVSRFDGGELVEFDYDAFHLRLIANRIGYDEFNGESVHRHLGRQYFETDTLTDEQYERAKKQTFFWLYNGLTEEALEYPYFEQVQNFVERKWKLYKSQGYVETLGVGRKIKDVSDPTPNKVFNYLIQSYETEVALTALKRARDRLQATENPRPRVCLYTFDSFLFDVPEGADITELRHVLSYDNKYPMSVNRGENYAQIS